MILLSGFAADGVYNEVRMNMQSIRVRSNHNLMARNFFCQLQCNLMGLRCCQWLTGMEGLDHVVVHPSVSVLMKSLGVHELLQCKLRNTIYTADQLSALILGFGFLTTVVDHTIHSTYGL